MSDNLFDQLPNPWANVYRKPDPEHHAKLIAQLKEAREQRQGRPYPYTSRYSRACWAGKAGR